MRKFLVSGLLLMLVACTPTAPAPQPPPPGPDSLAGPTVHLVVTGDTNNRYNCVQEQALCADEIISRGFASNVGKMRDVAAEIPRLPTAPGTPPMKVNLVVVQGDQFTCRNISDAIDGLPVRPGVDVIWFHHSGHGLNAGSGPDPEFQMLQCGPFSPLSDFRAKILAKQPRLALIFADSCNVGSSAAEPAVPAPPFVNYLPLLTNYRGWLMGGAASPGEFSWYTSFGGTYTQTLLSVVRSATDWDRVINSSALKQLETAGAANTIQHPIFKSALQRM